MLYQDQELTHQIISAAIEVHKTLGPGLLESIYQLCLSTELNNLGLSHMREVVSPIFYKGTEIQSNFRIDFLIENKVILEIKSLDIILPVHHAQLLTYLRLTKIQTGLLINFNVPLLKEGIYRRVFKNFVC